MNSKNAKDYLPLVQALADGKKIQWLNTYGIWEDSEELSTSWIPGSYRIKPEPREIWVNYYPDQSNSLHENFMSAAARATHGTVTRHYREVIE